MSRTSNSLRNATAAVGAQFVSLLLRFVCQTVFLRTLGQEYLGISSLYTNILTLLSIAELGLSSAVTYSLYAPLAQNDQSAVRAVLAFFRRAYRLVALAVTLLGLALLPMLPILMTGATDTVNIYLYYLLYLAQAVTGYLFFSYKSVLLAADQKKYAAQVAACGCQIGVNVLQIAVLLIWHSFFGYTLLSIAAVVLTNLLTAQLTDRLYPWLKSPTEPLRPPQRQAIRSRVKAAALYHAATAVGTAKDSLLISSFVSLSAAGLYSNYSLIVGVIQALLSNVFQSFSASIGNLWATRERSYCAFIFRCLHLLCCGTVCLCSVCFLTLFQPFISLWAGKNYLLPAATVGVIVLNFMTNHFQTIPQLFCNASGIFVRGKWRAVANAILNIVLSLILVQHFSITGVLLGSVFSRLLTGWWFDPWLLYRAGFGASPRRYFIDCGVCFSVTVICTGIVFFLFPSATNWYRLLLRGITGASLSLGCYLLLYGRSSEFSHLLTAARQFLRRNRA